MDELKEFLSHSITANQWNRIGIKPHHGIDLYLSSLHSAKSCGIGEFFDLIPIIDWCQKLQMDVIQLLPLNNANSESDPSPYNAISSCAMNFLNLSLHALPFLEKYPALQEQLKELTKFNATERIAYSDVVAHKLSWLHSYCDAVEEKLIKQKEFKEFIAQNPWLEPYALFRVLKEKLKNTSWTTWPESLRPSDFKQREELLQLHSSQVNFYLIVQFLCYHQLKQVKAYANQKGVYLMGDIPILLSIESADVWEHPEYFDITLSAGAPPDFYNQEGQNWGFPLFRWDVLQKKQFDWWKQRLRYAENFFDLFRIDHVIGFFRIWSIPYNHPSKDGHFIPRDEKEWGPQGKELLTMIASSTQMLPIAEDLGTVPPIVAPCLKELGVCGTKVMRWERKWEEDKRFIPIQYYPPISLTCVSTHDSETLTLWWKNFAEEAKAFADYKHWPYNPVLHPLQREEILWDSHHTSSLFHINLLQEYLALFPELIWPTPEEERINIPGKILPSNWTYRFKPSVEELTSHPGLFSKMEKILFAPSPPHVDLS